MRLIDMTGKRFGKMVILERAPATGGEARWRFKCDCGSVSVAAGTQIRRGQQSCSCSRFRHGYAADDHARSEYKSWQAMIQRCTNPKNPKYPRYGGRGIKVCDRWKDFSLFIADMGEKPGAGYSIERNDNDGNYEPNNCRWATAKEQSANRSVSKHA